jgi:Raf kinase inhibitor-like YbhB/YbcL family protein
MRGCVWLAVSLWACGGSDAGAIDAPGTTDPDAVIDGVNSGIDTPPTEMAITSTALAEGGAFPEVHTCGPDGMAANTSPPLAWVGPPAGTQSFAVVLTDRTVGLIHSVIYDIPGAATGLPADVDKVFAPPDVAGAHQTVTLGGVAFGYAGPCPPPGAAAHTYRFELFALDVASLGADMTTTQSQARTLILAHDLASVELTGTYQR